MCDVVTNESVRRANRRLIGKRTIQSTVGKSSMSARIRTMSGTRSFTFTKEQIKTAASNAMRSCR